MRRFDVSVSDGRRPEKQISRRGIYLAPGEEFMGPLPLDVRYGTATLGVHDESDRRTDTPNLVDGQISMADLLIYADEFDTDEGRWSARDFLVSLLPDVVGTEERERHLEARAHLIKQASGE